MDRSSLKVVHFCRRPHKGYFSIERLFVAVRQHLPAHVRCDVAIATFESHGLFRRLYIMLEAALRQGRVNHVTGDIHFVTLLMNRKRTILTVADCVLLNRFRGVRRWIYRLFWYALPVKCSARITVISQAVKRELLSHVRCDPERIHVIHVPVSSDFVPNPRVFNATKPVILQVGTRENKNLLRVASALRGVPCHLRILGDVSADQRNALRDNRIEYSSISEVTDAQVVQEYVNCDMLLFASTYEGFGMPTIEAQAVGRPVVTSTIQPMPEVAGAGACLVDPMDIASIRRGVLRVIENAEFREQLVEQGLRNAERFRAPFIASQYGALYEEVADRSGRKRCE